MIQVGIGFQKRELSEYMALETSSDLASFFNTDDHGVSVTFTPDGGSASTIVGILNNEFQLVDVGETGVESTMPVLTVRTADVPSLAQGDAFVIDSVNYKSVIVRPDGTGVTEIQLEAQ